MLGKTCTSCGEYKELTKFWNRKCYKDGYSPRCKSCWSDQKSKQAWRDGNKDYQNQWRLRNVDKCNLSSLKSRIKHKYKISLSDYEDLISKQGNSCAICKTHQDSLYRRLSIDHCHKTGKVRGLLCDRCNKSIGAFNDDVQLLDSAINYLLTKN